MAKEPDHFSERAKNQGYAARSVFKLEEMDRKFQLLRSGHQVLDLGAAPGSWMQYTSKKVGDKGLVLGLDKNSIEGEFPGWVERLQVDVFELEHETIRKYAKVFDVVMSDMAPKTTGNRITDHQRSFDICVRAFEIAEDFLKLGGTFLCKMYQGEETKVFVENLKRKFETAKIYKPKVSRSESREIFILGLGFLPS